MKHHCHCGLEKHLRHFRVKKFGILGAALMVAHIMFHVVECLILPAVIVGLSGHAVEEQAAAADESVMTQEQAVEDVKGIVDTSALLVDFQQSLYDMRAHEPRGGVPLTLPYLQR